MIRKVRHASIGVGVIVAAVMLAGCASGAGATKPSAGATSGSDGLTVAGEKIADAALLKKAQDEGTLVFYTGASADSEAVLTKAFTADTGVKVQVVRLAPNRLTERILSEQGAGKLGADAIRTSGEDLTVSIAKSGAFTPYTGVPASFNLPKDTSIDNGMYYRSYDRLYSFAYNNQLVKPADAPKDWKDLLDPKWKGHLGIVQVGAGGSTAALTRFMIEKLGSSYLSDFAAQKPRIFDSSGNSTDSLARGEVEIATMPIATGYSAIQAGAPLTIAMPSEGAAAYSYYLGVASKAAHPAAAQLFVNWSLSKRGQEVSGKMGDYPVRTDVTAPTIGDQKLPAVDSGFAVRASTEDILSHVTQDADQWKKIFGYTG